MPTRPAPQPEAEASSASSAAQPARQEPAGSALPPRHHRVNAVFGTDDPSMAPLQEVLEQIGSQFLFGKVASIVASSTGCYELATVPCIVEKLEAFLEIVEEQRSRHLRRHPSLTSDAVFSHEDMQEIHRAWEEDHESWMNGETIRNYNWWLEGTGKGDHQRAHQLRRSAFSAFVFQIIGNKHMVLASIQHPICSAAQPADAMQRFMRAWEEEKSSKAYKKRMQISDACASASAPVTVGLGGQDEFDEGDAVITGNGPHPLEQMAMAGQRRRQSPASRGGLRRP